MKSTSRDFGRFVIAGVVNTGLGYVLYLLLVYVLPYQVVYGVTYLFGIGLSYYLNSRFVFRQPLHWKKALQFPLVYAVQFGLGLVIVTVSVELLHIDERLASPIATVFTLPVTFLLSRSIIGRAPRTDSSGA